MSTTPCPICGSRDLRHVDADWRCNRCDTLFSVQDGGTVIRIAGEAPSQSGRSGLVAMALAGSLVAGGAAYWWSQQPGPAVDEVVANAKPPTPIRRPPPQAQAPQIELPFIEAGTLEDGTMFWLVTYRNVGKDPIENLVIVAHFYDKGTITGEVRAAAPVKQLEPDEDTVVLLVAKDPPKHTRVEVAADVPTFAKRTQPTVTLGTDGVQLSTSPRGNQLTGTIRNIHRFKVKVTDVVVVGRDKNGRPVSWAPAGPDEPNLAPGEETVFEARPGVYEIDVPAVWTAFAIGTPAKGQ